MNTNQSQTNKNPAVDFQDREVQIFYLQHHIRELASQIYNGTPYILIASCDLNHPRRLEISQKFKSKHQELVETATQYLEELELLKQLLIEPDSIFTQQDTTL